MIATDQQCDLIRARVAAYYELHHNGPRKMTWAGLCDEIFDLMGVAVRLESLRQFATGFIAKGRKRPRMLTEVELEATVSFLLHPAINMLVPEELNAPEIPYRFARFLLDFLCHPTEPPLSPPVAFGGRYLARLKADDASIVRSVELMIDIRPDDPVLRVTEKSYRGAVDTNDYSGPPKKALFDAIYRANGWGVVTPEGNLILFMKKTRYGFNHYYLSLGLSPDFSSESWPTRLALLRHEAPAPPPYFAAEAPDTRSLDELMRETDGGTVLLHFSKVAEADTAEGTAT